MNVEQPKALEMSFLQFLVLAPLVPLVTPIAVYLGELVVAHWSIHWSIYQYVIGQSTNMSLVNLPIGHWSIDQ